MTVETFVEKGMAKNALVQSSEGVVATIAGLVTEVAIRLQRLERHVEVSFGVDDAFVEAIAAMPGAEVRETIYVREAESYVIRAATIRIGHVDVHAQAEQRPATSAELEAAGGWYEHVDPGYRAGQLRSVT
jgi:hypothetical protein